MYAGTVVGLQALLPVGGADVAVAASTLVGAALFNPLRRVVQAGLDRRFNQARYEADLVKREFAQRLRQELDLDTINSDLSAVVQRTMQPVAVGLWLPAASHRDDAIRSGLVSR